MPNMRMDKNPMPEQCPNVRNKNFLEVTTGYTEEMAIDEAQRCLNCKHKHFRYSEFEYLRGLQRSHTDYQSLKSELL